MANLRVIADDALPGRVNMTRDASLLAQHRPGDAPVLRIYRWNPPAVSIGYNQDESDFDAAGLAAAGWDLVRRPTGGRAILHAAELTYAVIGSSPSDLFGDSLHTTYERINAALLRFLRRLGIAAEVSSGESRQQMRDEACFISAGQHEIRVDGRKLIGSAQRRRGGVFLQHGSILTGADHADLARYLGSPAHADRRRADLVAATTDLGSLLSVTPTEPNYRDWTERLVEAFTALCR